MARTARRVSTVLVLAALFHLGPALDPTNRPMPTPDPVQVVKVSRVVTDDQAGVAFTFEVR